MDKPAMYRVDFHATPWVAAAAGARYKVQKQGGRQIRLVEFSKDFVESDWCRKGHIGYVLEGQMEVDFNGTAVTFMSGDGLLIPAGEKCKHKLTVLTSVVKLIMVEDI